MSKLMKQNGLNMNSLLYVIYTVIKLEKRKKKSLQKNKEKIPINYKRQQQRKTFYNHCVIILRTNDQICRGKAS